jgi:hypothetical protein
MTWDWASLRQVLGKHQVNILTQYTLYQLFSLRFNKLFLEELETITLDKAQHGNTTNWVWQGSRQSAAIMSNNSPKWL